MLVIGLDALRSLDSSCGDFLELLAAECGAAIADTGANVSAALAGAFRTGRSIIVGEALIATPLQAGSHARGSVAFSFESPHTFTPEAEKFVDLLAQQCGLALDRASARAATLRSSSGCSMSCGQHRPGRSRPRTPSAAGSR